MAPQLECGSVGVTLRPLGSGGCPLQLCTWPVRSERRTHRRLACAEVTQASKPVMILETGNEPHQNEQTAAIEPHGLEAFSDVGNTQA